MARRTEPTAATVRLVRDRDRWACAHCGLEADMRLTLTTHHRRNRGMGGSRWPGINLPANLLTLCGSGTTGCHGWVTENPREARDLGLSVSQHADPEWVTVKTWRGWVRLSNDGQLEAMETETA